MIRKTRIALLGKGTGPMPTPESLLPYEVQTTWSTIVDLRRKAPDFPFAEINFTTIIAVHPAEEVYSEICTFAHDTFPADRQPVIVTSNNYPRIPFVPRTLTDSIAILLYRLVAESYYPEELRLMRCSYLDPTHFFNRSGVEILLAYFLGSNIPVTIDEPTALMKYPIYPDSLVQVQKGEKECSEKPEGAT
jgi:hypothetical protein